MRFASTFGYSLLSVFVVANLMGCRDKRHDKNRQAPGAPSVDAATDDENDHEGEGGGSEDGGSEEGDTPKPTVYGKKVEPTLASIQSNLIDPYCLPCHNATIHKANLDLTELGVYSDGAHGPSEYSGRLIAPAAPLDSMLILVLKSAGRDRMPPAGSGIPSATREQILAVSTWISSLPKPSDGGSDTTEPDGSDDGDLVDSGEPGADDEGGGSDEPF